MNRLIFPEEGHRSRLKSLAENCNGTIRIASPYVTDVQFLKLLTPNRVRLLTRHNDLEILTGATSIEVLVELAEMGVEIRKIASPKLHCKIYAFANTGAIVTSANLTINGLDSSLEIGYEISDDDQKRLEAWFDRFWSIALPWPIAELRCIERDTRIQRQEFRYRYHLLNQSTAKTLHRRRLVTDADIPSLKFYVCNTNRANSRDFEKEPTFHEELMKKHRFAGAWEKFRYSSRMKEVEKDSIIFMFAKEFGIIGVGQAKGPAEKFFPQSGKQIYSGFGSPEWRIPVNWLGWVEDEKAIRMDPSPKPTFMDISSSKYADLRDEVWSKIVEPGNACD